MRIWSFPSFYPLDLPNRRWNGIFAHRQNVGLKEQGVEVKVVLPVTYKYPAPFDKVFPCNTDVHSRSCPRYRELDGIPVYHPVVPDPRPNRLFGKSYQEKYVAAILAFFARQGIALGDDDFFYAQWMPDAGLVLQAAKALGVKTGILVIGDDVTVLPYKSEAYKAFFVRSLQEADLRFAVSRSLAAESCEISGQALDFKVVRRGVDHALFSPPTPAQKIHLREKWGGCGADKLLLCVGSAIRRKGWIELLDALQELVKQHPAVKLMAVYAGGVELDLRHEAHQRGLQDRFIDLGEVNPEIIPEIFQAADYFCLPSYWEGLSNAVAEAMSCGLPVVTTNVSGHPEIIEHGTTGLLIEPRSSQAIAEALHLLLGNPELAQQLGANARRFICSEWGDFRQNSAKVVEAFARLQ